MSGGTYHHARGDVANRAYERGWSEGWNACLARVQERGLEAVLELETKQSLVGQMALPATAEIHGSEGGSSPRAAEPRGNGMSQVPRQRQQGSG